MPTRIVPSTRSFICAACRCKARGSILTQNSFQKSRSKRRSYGTTTSSPNPGFFPQSSSLHSSQQTYVRLSNRSLLRLHGPDALHFLNGLLPSRLQPLPKDQAAPAYTAFLNAKGRLLYDVFVYPPLDPHLEGPWYIEVEASSATALLAHLKKHKLRSKFKLERVDTEEMAVYYVWPSSQVSKGSYPQMGGKDPRALMGTRFISPLPAPSEYLEFLKSSATELSVEDYTIHRMLSGHAEGPTELIAGSALPQESNLDFSDGIDFHKGCYLGQELTIRTHHTGVVRKRIIPCQIYLEDQFESLDHPVPIYDSSVLIAQPPPETNISKVRFSGSRAGRSTGKWLGGVGNIGLALCRLEMMTDMHLTAESTMYDPSDQFALTWEDGGADAQGRTNITQVKLKPFVPAWLRSSIETSLKARSERGQKRRQDADEYGLPE